MAPKPEAREKLDAFGIDAVCEAIAARKTLTQIARKVGVSLWTLLAWLNADASRSARARETRAGMAKHWDEQAEAEIRKAKDPLALAKARELAHHFRWRASKIAPAEYGEKIEFKGTMTLGQLVEAAQGKPDEPSGD